MSMIPSSISITPGTQMQFFVLRNATIFRSVTWHLSAPIGTIDANGLYKAPATLAAPTNLTITARSTLDSATVSSTFEITPKSYIQIFPAAASVASGRAVRFSATVVGLNDSRIYWGLSPSLGKISGGLYVAPVVSVPTRVTLTATSMVSPAIKATAQITIQPPPLANSSTAAPPPSLALSPSSISMAPGASFRFAALRNGQSTTAVNWSISPSLGSIAGGTYTAPAQISSPAVVTVTARLLENSQIAATSTVTVVPPVQVSLTPTQTTIASGGQATFTATVSGSTNRGVSWILTPALGTIVGGVYRAPTVSTITAVTVRAVSLADPSKFAAASITIQPSAKPTLTISPPSRDLTGGAQATFTALANGVPTTQVSWQLSPAVGTIANGVYTAPATLSAPTTVRVIARSLQDSTVSAAATVNLRPPVQVTLTPAQAEISSGGKLTLSAQVANTSNTGLSWSLIPAIGSISNGVYQAPLVSTTTSVTVRATSQADPTRYATAQLKIVPAANQVVFPLEVFGPLQTVRPVAFSLSAADVSRATRLALQIHGLDFNGEGSVKVNNGPWMELSETNLRLNELEEAYGGIGGGFSTLRCQLPLQSGWLAAGQNVISFRFNRTNGISNGFRVLSLNLIDLSGAELLPASLFRQDDPASWQPPLPDANSIAAGKSLWTSAQLTVPVAASGGVAAIKARCSDCHTQDGRDLKYFNYSNASIRHRAMFHGLSSTQGDQIASYIRSLNVPAPRQARPWNPPYQPGPGLDSRPVQEWAAGAGLEAVLNQDRDTFDYLFPNGIRFGPTSPSAYFSAREIPVALQLPDWNRWLPQVHPMDAFPGFESSEAMRLYLSLRGKLVPGSASHYLWGAHELTYLRVRTQEFIRMTPIRWSTSSRWSETDVRARYSAMLWLMTKGWEVMQEFDLEDLSRNWFGAQADPRAWPVDWAFHASPNMVQIPVHSPGLGGNIRSSTHTYMSFMWYHLQLILNHSNKRQWGTTPIDWPYSYGFIMGLNRLSPQAGLVAVWQSKAGQAANPLRGPEFAAGGGWSWMMQNFPILLHADLSSGYRTLSAAERNAFLEAQLRGWLESVRLFRPAQFYQGNWTRATDTVNNSGPMFDGNFPTRIAWSLRELRRFGVNATLRAELAAWAQTVWPYHNWKAEL